jgi:arginase family enzyme
MPQAADVSHGSRDGGQPGLCPGGATRVNTTAVIFSFDLFGSGGTAAGAQLVADELREILADNRRERVPTRARSYTDRLKLKEISFQTLESVTDWRARGRRAARQVLRQGDFLLWLTGNHLGALPIYDELAGDGSVLVVQLDAHLDVHHFADCTPEPSHGNFLLHCDGPLPAIINVGHRDLLLTDDHVRTYYRRTFGAAELALDPAPALAHLRDAVGGAGRVFLDLDCDVFDPAYFPAVTQPVPFGLTPSLVLRLLDAAWTPRLAGLFVSEFEPGRDRNDQSLATVVWLLEYVLLRKYESLAENA